MMMKFIRRAGRIIPIKASQYADDAVKAVKRLKKKSTPIDSGKIRTSVENHKLMRQGAEHGLKENGASHSAVKNYTRKVTKEKKILALKAKNKKLKQKYSDAKTVAGTAAVGGGLALLNHLRNKNKKG